MSTQRKWYRVVAQGAVRPRAHRSAEEAWNSWFSLYPKARENSKTNNDRSYAAMYTARCIVAEHRADAERADISDSPLKHCDIVRDA